MTSVSKYRKISVIAATVMVVLWLAAMAALWNSLLTAKDVRNEGWIIVFMILLVAVAGLLFYIAFIHTDSLKLAKISSDAFDAGRNQVLHEIEAERKVEAEENADIHENERIISSVLSSVHALRSETSFCNKLIAGIAREFEIVQAVMFLRNKKDGIFNPVAEYAITDRKPQPFKEGDNLNGQVALNKIMTILYDVPENYFVISSGLGSSQPHYLIIAPVVFNDQAIAVIEMATFRKPSENSSKVLEKILEEVGNKLNKFTTD